MVISEFIYKQAIIYIHLHWKFKHFSAGVCDKSHITIYLSRLTPLLYSLQRPTLFFTIIFHTSSIVFSRVATSPRFLESESSSSPACPAESSRGLIGQDSSQSPSPAGFESESRCLWLKFESKSKGVEISQLYNTWHLPQYHK